MKRLRKLMLENNLTYQKLSNELKKEKINIAPDTLRKWAVSERVPNVYNALDLADYFNVSLDYLVGRSDKR